MSKIRIAIIVICLAFATGRLQAQEDPEYRFEVGVGAGATGYLGDFNGNLTKDLQPMGAIMGRYVINPWMAVRASLSYGKMKGSSADNETWYPQYEDRTYSFDNNLYDLSFTYEYNFWPYGTGWDYRGSKRITPFVFAGMGIAYCDTPEKGRTAFNVPLGVGLKYKIGERVNLGVEWAMHFTTSDWLDGVKDPYSISSSGTFKNTDCFTQLMVTLSYSFSPRCLNCNRE